MATSTAKTHLRIHATAHIADKALLHTSTHAPHPIITGAHCVIHPFARLDASNGPVALGDRCVVWEKAVIGSPRSASRPSSSAEHPATHGDDDDDEDEQMRNVKTITMGDGTIVQPHAKILGPATIGTKCNIGIAAEIGAGVILGEGVTVASGTVVPNGAVLEKGSVIFGQDGRIRRPSKDASEEVQRDLEKARELKEEGEERHRTLMERLVKGTAGGTRFTG